MSVVIPLLHRWLKFVMDSTMFGSLLARFLSFILFNVIFVVSSLIACKKKVLKEPTASAIPPTALAGDAKGDEEKQKSAKERSKKESSKKNGSIKSAKKSLREPESKKIFKNEKEKSVKKEVKEDEKPASPNGDTSDKKEALKKVKEKKETQENFDVKDENKKPEEKKPEEKGEENKDGDAAPAAPGTSPAAQTAIQLLNKVALEPAELRFSQDGGMSKLTVANNTGSRIAVKIKCSDNTLFRVNPVFSFIEKDGKCAIEVSRTTGNPKPDKIAVLTTEVADDAVDAQAIFKETPADKQATMSVSMHVN